MGGQRNNFALNIGGQRIHFNHYALDGIENTDLNFNSYMLLPSIDALQEFKVESGLFDAEYGRAIAQINASTRSGTNLLHGTAFEFLRNSALDAKILGRPEYQHLGYFRIGRGERCAIHQLRYDHSVNR